MDSPNMPFRPFSFQPNDSSKSLSRPDMEGPVSPNASLPSPQCPDVTESKDAQGLPDRNPRRSQILADATKSREQMVQKNSSPEYAPQIAGSSSRQPIPSSRSPTFYLPPSLGSFAFGNKLPSPTSMPPMTKSSQKIHQLTGFDPRFERALPIEHQQPSPSQNARPLLPQSPIRSISSTNLGSHYDQAEALFRYELAGSPRNSSTSIAQSSHPEGQSMGDEAMYNCPERNLKSSDTSSPTLEKKSNGDHKMQPPPLPQSDAGFQAQRRSEDGSLPPPSFPTSVHSRDSNEITTLPEILAQEKLRYNEGPEWDTSAGPKHNNSPFTTSSLTSPLCMISKPADLATKRRIKPKHITLTGDKKPSKIRAARDSLDWGIYDPSTSISPSRSKHPTTPVSPMYSMESDHLTLSPPLGSPLPMDSSPVPETPKSSTMRMRRRRFGSGVKHPLKSPFPFNASGAGAIVEQDEEVDSMPSPSASQTFKRRLSNTIKHLSPTSPSSKSRSHPPPSNSKKYVITNAARRADGPATPMPPKHGIVDSMMRGKEALEKVGKSVVGPSKEEKRRESLKKTIVVVGITDQSPDGRLSEWL